MNTPPEERMLKEIALAYTSNYGHTHTRHGCLVPSTSVILPPLKSAIQIILIWIDGKKNNISLAECWCNGLNYLCTQQMCPSVRLPSLKLCMSVEAMRSKCLLEPGGPVLIKPRTRLETCYKWIHLVRQKAWCIAQNKRAALCLYSGRKNIFLKVRI